MLHHVIGLIHVPHAISALAAASVGPTGHAAHAAAASRPGRSPEGAAGQGRTVRSPATAAAPGTVVPLALPGEGGARSWGVPGGWPLLVVLAVQAGLSLRLLRADTASQSEALYLRAGHLEWAHWLHGVPIPPFPEYLSGAPVLYPPVGVAADNIGGLARARVLSLVFMLGATVLLWGAAARLFGRRARSSGPHCSPCSVRPAPGGVRDLRRDVVFLVALAAWCVIRAGAREPATGGWSRRRSPGAGQRHGVYLLAVRPPHRRARPADLTLDRSRLARGPACRDRAGRYGGAAGRRTGDRREQLPGWFPADDADPGPWLGLPAVGARPVLVLGRPAAGPGRLRRRHQLGQPARRRADNAARVLVRRPGARAGGAGAPAYRGLAESHVGMGAWFAAIAAGYAVDRFIAAAPAAGAAP